MSSVLQSLWIEGGKRLVEAGVDEGVKEAFSMVTRLMGGDVGKVVLRSNELVPQDFDRKTLENWLGRRCQREPLAYLFEEKEFYGRTFKVGPGALVPRPETEILVESVLSRHQERPFRQGLDLCSGPGTLGMTLSLEMDLPFCLVELSAVSMSWAEKNLNHLEPKKVTLEQGDVRDLSGIEGYDLIVCNPPYVESEVMGELMPEVRDFEPSLALDGGLGGLVFLRQLMDKLRNEVSKGSELFVEVGAGQKKSLEENPPEGWTRHAWHKDLAGVDRVAHYLFLDESDG